MQHILKTDPAVFQAVVDGAKTYEIRFNDRGFAVGDELLLRETTATGAEIAGGAALGYTGREVVKHVSHVLTGYGLTDGWAILSFAERATPAAASAGAAGTIDTPSITKAFQAAVKEFVEAYEIDTGEGIYQPNDHEKFLIDMALHDAVNDDELAPAIASLLRAATAPVSAAQVLTMVGEYMDGAKVVGVSGNFVRHADHIRQMGAAVEAARKETRDYYEAKIADLFGAATAPVSAVPGEPTEAMLNAARDWSVKKYGIGIGSDAAIGCWGAMYAAALPPSAGAPVSAAEQADLRAFNAAMDEQAGGQELPALTDAQIVAVMRPHLDKADAGYACDTCPEHVAAAGKALLAMRQPQGDAPVDCRKIGGDVAVIISQDTAIHALDAMREKYNAGGYANLFADDRSFVVHGIYELEAASKAERAAKQAGKEGA
jgi:hypothetical protein